MTDGWKEVRFGEITELIKRGIAPKYVEEGGYIVINQKCIRDGVLSFGDSRLSSKEKKVAKEKFVQIGDVLINSTGTGTLGRTAPVRKLPGATTVDTHVTILRGNETVDKLFLGYLASHYEPLITLLGKGSTNQIELGASDLKVTKVVIPESKETQRKIASILSAYDDLIENNLKRIKLLEEKAQLTYEEWFVRMKFPGHETTPINKETGLPEGWEEVKLSQIAEFLNGFAFKPKHLGAQGMPVIKIKEMKNGVVDDTPRNNGTDIADKYLVENGDILFSWSATLEVVIWKFETGLLNQHLFKVTPNVGYGKSYVFLSTKNSLPIFDILTTGATMKHIKRKELDFVKLNKPPKNVMNEFEGEVSPVITKVLNLSKQNQLLKEARDILLPRLMTGMIDVEQMNLETLKPTTA